jgi:hypothetical protein
MNKFLKIALITILIACTSAIEKPGTELQNKVYICVSSTAYAYHWTESCRGLQRCTHRIIAVTLDEAKNTYQRRACGICYK